MTAPTNQAIKITAITDAAPAPPKLFVTKKGGELFQEVEVGPWTGVTAVPKPIERVPSNRWHGAKIPYDVFRQVLAFFEWSMEETKSETIVNLFLNEGTGEWQALVLPQAGYNGMTVKLIDDHPNRIPTYQRLGRGWRPMGTVHHHCTASAFQSGTDSNDERSKEGIHVTIGDVTSRRYTIHARTSFREEMTSAILGDWFHAAEPAVYGYLPPSLHEEALEYQLTEPPVDRSFPDWWKANVIKVERPVVIYNSRAPHFGDHHDGTTMARKWEDDGWHLKDGVWKKKAAAEAAAALSLTTRRAFFKRALEDLQREYQLEPDEIPVFLENMLDPVYSDIILALRECDLTPEEGAEVTAELNGEVGALSAEEEREQDMTLQDVLEERAAAAAEAEAQQSIREYYGDV